MMDISSLNGFLSWAKANIQNIDNNLGDIHAVLGNEAADLDSVVSAIVTGYYIAHSISKEEKENKADDQQSFVFPVINCTREDLPLRTEVNYFLKDFCKISTDILICRDEIDLFALQSSGKLKLTLVDHNKLAPQDNQLQPSVCKVIDHHNREKAFDRRDVIEEVGSCCTVVAEMVLGLFKNEILICQLLYGTILLDSINLSPKAGKATSKDIKIIEELEESLSRMYGTRPSREEIYNKIVQARADISRLTPAELLRKDCKIAKFPEISIAVPAIPCLTKKYKELPDSIEALKNYLRVNRVTAILLMGYEAADDGITRDLAIFSDQKHKAIQVCKPLEKWTELQLELLYQINEPQSSIFIYKQNNVTYSRKKILPFLAKHFEEKAQLDIEVDVLLSNGDTSPSKTNSNGNAASSVPSISLSSASSLAVGDPISQGGSSQSSAYNSCPYTPQNSCAEPEEGYSLENYFLPSFNSREMIEKIELKRGKLRGYERPDNDELKLMHSSYPFTPKNSYVDSNMEAYFERNQQQSSHHHHSGGVLQQIDSEVLLKKLLEKRRSGANEFSSNSSSKSQSLTKLNLSAPEDERGDGINVPTRNNFSPRSIDIPDFDEN